jgi:GNAT superfamily N-acetyltransferase
VASGNSRPLVIRDPAPHDEGAWRVLRAGYCAFYETSVPEAVTAGIRARILTPGSPLFGRIAQWKGEVADFTVSVLHRGSWTLDPICYLEDLFVAPKARGHGIRRALIADLLTRAKERG